MSVILETERLIIREFLPEELEMYLQHFTDERVTLHLPKRGRDERTTIFTNALKHYEVTKTAGIWGMFNKANGEFVGSCLLRPFDDESGVLELGYSLEHKYWGLGLGTEMAKAVIAHGMADEEIKEVVAVTTMDNVASQHVIKKAGLIKVDNIVRGDEELAFFRMQG